MANLFRCASSQAFQFVVESIAQPFDENDVYNAGDHVIYEDLLYECLEDGTTGPWDPNKWKRTYLSEIYLDGIEPCKSGQGVQFSPGGSASIAPLYPTLFKKLSVEKNNFAVCQSSCASRTSGRGENSGSGPYNWNYNNVNGTFTCDTSSHGMSSPHFTVYVLPKGVTFING